MAGKLRSQRMAVVLQLAVRTEEGAAKALEEARSHVANAVQQLQQIQAYQQDYTRELNQPRQGVSVDSIVNDRRFLTQLMQVVSVQENQLQQLQNNESNCLRNWQLCYQRRKNIERMIEGLKAGEDALMEKQLQKELDELSSLSRLHR